MRIVARAMLALLCLVMAGCVARPYVDPAGKDIAEITFHNEGAARGTAEIFDKAETCKRRRVSAPIRPGGAVSVKIPAGRALSFSLGYRAAGSGDEYCRAYATFAPQLHARYDAYIRPGPGGCALALRRQTETRAAEAVDFRRRAPLGSPLTEYSAFCR
jgi:hypothetical protein